MVHADLLRQPPSREYCLAQDSSARALVDAIIGMVDFVALFKQIVFDVNGKET
jgi:hypothetical protein